MLKTRKRKRGVVVLVALLLFVAVVVLLLWGNATPVISLYTVSSKRVPEGFDGFCIVQISDLHNAQFGDNNGRLLAIMQQQEPDMIAITGDIIDCYDTDLDVAVSFAREAAKIAPCYYVTGNHEARLAGYGDFKRQLQEAGVTVLDNSSVELEKDGDVITLTGVMDIAFLKENISDDEDLVMHTALQELCREEVQYRILLSHRPSQFEVYVAYELDLVLSGHMHGGQFRIPGLGGLYTPSDGFFPEYDAGLFQSGNTQMVVSRGLGNSIFPLRINNRPDVVVVRLERDLG